MSETFGNNIRSVVTAATIASGAQFPGVPTSAEAQTFHASPTQVEVLIEIGKSKNFYLK